MTVRSRCPLTTRAMANLYNTDWMAWKDAVSRMVRHDKQSPRAEKAVGAFRAQIVLL
jgi:hypothetical protein